MKSGNRQSIVLTITSLILLVALVGSSWTTVKSAVQQQFVIPTINIVSINADQSVTIQTNNFPANDSFTVLMGQFGTLGIGGTVVETFDSSTGGSVTRTFNIPAGLKGLYQIAIRLQSTRSGYYAYNWFYNNTSGTVPDTGSLPTQTPVPSLPSNAIPTFSITSVSPDTSVTIRTANFPANDIFTVRMGLIGTLGVGAGGAQTATFNIPANLKGKAQIAIRLESPTSRYFSYNWFYNNSTGTVPDTGQPTQTPVPGVPSGLLPTFSISSVAQGAAVTIQTANVPANDTFTVTMGAFGTLGIGGTVVGTFDSGAGGAQTATFNIPAGMQSSNPIAIRLQSTRTGYFAYNWFYNRTHP